MTDIHLDTISTQLAGAVDAASPAVVQVQGRRRPASGIVFDEDLVLTTGRALGRDQGVRVRTPDGRVLEGEVAGWDPATHLAVVKVKDLGIRGLPPVEARARVGQVVLALARSWSNAITATLGNVAVIGGPLPTGRGHAIDEVIRTSAPMHGGFAGGALIDANGRLIGVTTAVHIRGLGVVIPAGIALATARQIAERGQVKRGYLGLAGQAVTLSERQRGASGPETALLVVGVKPGSPADSAGLFVGDLVTAFDGTSIESADRLLELLTTERVGRTVTVDVLRGDRPVALSATVGER